MAPNQRFGKNQASRSNDRDSRRTRPGPEPSSRGSEDRRLNLVMGRHPVLEALRQGRPMSKIWVLSGMHEGSMREIWGLAEARHIPVRESPRAKLDLLTEGLDGPHQGVVAEVAAHSTVALEDLIAELQDEVQPMIFVLDGIQDPHNLGAILRVADAAGVRGVVIPERGSAGLTAVVDKVSAGAAEYVPVARVSNLVNAIETLKNQQFFIFAADPAAEHDYTAIDWRGRMGLVIGGEGKGVRPLVRARCDGVVKIPMAGHIQSLNASTAAAVVAFEMVRQRVSTQG